mgnify:CR=1 FL=1
MTTVLTFRCDDPEAVLEPTECVMDEWRQWTLVYGSQFLNKLQGWTTLVELNPQPGGYSTEVQIQHLWTRRGYAGKFIPAWSIDQEQSSPDHIY